MEAAALDPLQDVRRDEVGIVDDRVRQTRRIPTAVALRIQDRRAREERVHVRDVDAVLAQVHGQRFAEAAQPELGRGVRRQLGRAHDPRDRRDVHDVPAAPLDHPRQEQREQPHRGQQVHLHEPLPLLARHVVYQPAHRAAGVVDQDVDARHELGAPREQCVGARGLGQVRLGVPDHLARRARRRGPRLRGRGLECVPVQVREHEPAPGRQEPTRHRTAEPAAGAGQEDDLPTQ